MFPDIQGWPIRYAPFDRILREAFSAGLPIIAPAQGPGKSTEIVEAAKAHDLVVILTSVNYSTLSEALVLMGEYDDLYLTTDMLNTPDGVELVSDELGPDRLVFGSNYPFTYFSGPLLAVQRSRLQPEVKRRILRENLLRILAI